MSTYTFPLWTSVDSVRAKPRPGAIRDWWTYCDECRALERHPDEATARSYHHTCTPKPAPVRKTPSAPRRRYHTWTEAEDEILKTHNLAAAAAIVGVSIDQAKTRRMRLIKDGAIEAGRTEWTPDQDAVVLQHPPRIASKLLGRTVPSVASRRRRLISLGAVPSPDTRAWTAEEDALVLQHDRSKPVAEATGRTIRAVQQRRSYLRRRAAMQDEEAAA